MRGRTVPDPQGGTTEALAFITTGYYQEHLTERLNHQILCPVSSAFKEKWQYL